MMMMVAAAMMAGAKVLSLEPVPQSADAKSWWQQRFAQKAELVKKGGSEVVFIGDSITHFWEGAGAKVWAKHFAKYNALNLGYSADRTEHVLWRIAHGELDGYKAKVIVLMIGTNNTGHRLQVETAADTILGVRAILKAISEKQPQAKIILLPIFPRGRDLNDAMRQRNTVVNNEIMRYADGENIFWCDFTEQFLTADGVLPLGIMRDRLHPGEQGYEIWASAVAPMIDNVLAGRPIYNRYASCIAPNTTQLDSITCEPATRINDRNQDWWSNRLEQKRNQIADSKGAIDIVFFGDSITHNWESGCAGNHYKELCAQYRILNIGYGGDRVEHLIWRAQNGELDGYKAKLIMLMIGTNNSGSDQPAQVAAGIKKLLGIIAAKQPDAKVLLLPIFPRGATAQDKLRVKNNEVNAIIKGFADGEKVVWLDFNQQFLEADGTLTKEMMGDLLHPGEKGYGIWRAAVEPYFKAAVGK